MGKCMKLCARKVGRQGGPCILCGKAHSVRFCKLPGAAQFRKLRSAASALKPKIQCLNKPRRFACARSRGAYRKKTHIAYSGKAAAALNRDKERARKNPVADRRAPVGDATHQASCQRVAVKEMHSAGWLTIPTTCPACKFGSLLENTPASKQCTQVVYQCNWADCKQSFSALSFSTVLPPNPGRGLTPEKIDQALKAYCAGGIAKPPSPEDVAKQVNAGRKPIERLFKALTAKEAALGEDFNNNMKLSLNIEVDGHRLRTGSLGSKLALRLYPDLVKEWQTRNKGVPMPKYFLMPLIVVGAFQRGSDKFLLSQGSLKLSAPGAKPGTESIKDVEGGDFFSKINGNSVIFPDGAKAWDTVAARAGKNFAVAPVVHQRSESVKLDRRAKKMNASRMRGTQTAYCRWDHLDFWVERNLCTPGRRKPSPALFDRVRTIQFRSAHAISGNYYKRFGSFCKAHNRPCGCP